MGCNLSDRWNAKLSLADGRKGPAGLEIRGRQYHGQLIMQVIHRINRSATDKNFVM